ncbi:MAG: MFS transporter [Chitinophagia bacterium]|jgi:MFS family permease|nr:MFS transporter [Chitinophagia bacterium]
METIQSPVKQLNDPLGALRISEFRNLMIGRFLFIMGLRMMGTLVGWWIYELTNAPFAIGLIGLAEVIPAVSLALYAGHVIDKSEKRKLLLRGVILYWCCALILLFLSMDIGSLKLTSLQIAIGIYFIVFCTGIIRSFTGPSFGTIIGAVVPKNLLQNATTWSQGIWLSASVLGHAIVGFIIAGFGHTGSLIVVVSLVGIGYGFIAMIKSKPPHADVVDQKTLESVKEGLRFVFNSKEVLGALSLDLFAVLFGGAVAMIPVFAKDILKVGPIGFGWLNAASDIGAIIIILIITIFPANRGQGKKLLLAVAGFGVCIIVFALSKIFWLSFVMLLLSGILDGFSMIVRGTIVQLKTPDHMRGRVMSVNSMFINSSNELGQFESGVAAKAMGVIPSVIFGGAMTLFVVGVTWFKAPALKKMEY